MMESSTCMLIVSIVMIIPLIITVSVFCSFHSRTVDPTGLQASTPLKLDPIILSNVVLIV